MKTNAREKLKQLIQEVYDLTSTGKINWSKVEKAKYRYSILYGREILSAFVMESPNLIIGHSVVPDESQGDRKVAFITLTDLNSTATETFFDYDLYSPLEANTLNDLVGLVRLNPDDIDLLIKSLRENYN